jgi:1,4-alpha-glucan branching enzyme
MVNATASSRPGMGAVPYAGGTTFRVWAPHAEQVHVAGTFNGWSKTANPMASENNGYWSMDIPGVIEGDQYKYVIRNGAKEFCRIDPYARDVTNSVGNSIVVGSSFDWGQKSYQTPSWHEMVIYEMHIGSFRDVPGGSPGNFNSAIRMLPHLVELGINAIQIMPPAEFAGGFSWGYNPAHIFAIEED